MGHHGLHPCLPIRRRRVAGLHHTAPLDMRRSNSAKLGVSPKNAAEFVFLSTVIIYIFCYLIIGTITSVQTENSRRMESDTNRDSEYRLREDESVGLFREQQMQDDSKWDSEVVGEQT